MHNSKQTVHRRDPVQGASAQAPLKWTRNAHVLPNGITFVQIPWIWKGLVQENFLGKCPILLKKYLRRYPAVGSLSSSPFSHHLEQFLPSKEKSFILNLFCQCQNIFIVCLKNVAVLLCVSNSRLCFSEVNLCLKRTRADKNCNIFFVSPDWDICSLIYDI